MTHICVINYSNPPTPPGERSKKGGEVMTFQSIVLCVSISVVISAVFTIVVVVKSSKALGREVTKVVSRKK